MVTTKYLKASNQYIQDRLAWCLAKRPIPAWENFLYFCNDLYLAIAMFIVVLIVMIVAYVSQMMERIRCDWNELLIMGLAIWLNIPCTFAPKSIPVRVGYMSFLLAACTFCIHFTARLTIWVTQANYFPQFKSFEEIIDAGYSLSGDSFAFAKLSNMNNVSNEHYKTMSISIITFAVLL